MLKRYLPVYLVVLVILSLAFIYGCGSNATGGGGGGGTTGRQYYGMSSMGDTVKCTLTDTTFSMNIVEGTINGMAFSGKITTLESGFLSAEVTKSNHQTEVPIGSVFYVLEITNEVLAVAGGQPDHGTILLCPVLSYITPPAGTYEGIMIPWTGWPAPKPMACMTAEITGSPGPYTVIMNLYDAAGGFQELTIEANYHFTGGRLFKDIDHPQIFVSPKGMFAGTNGKQGSASFIDGGFAGGMYDSTVSTLELADNRSYIGVVFYRDLTDYSTNIQAITVESASSNLLKVSSMDVSSGAAIGSPIITFEVGPINQGIIDAVCYFGGDTSLSKMVAYKYKNAPDKYAICGFTSIESNALSFFVIEK